MLLMSYKVASWKLIRLEHSWVNKKDSCEVIFSNCTSIKNEFTNSRTPNPWQMATSPPMHSSLTVLSSLHSCF